MHAHIHWHGCVMNAIVERVDGGWEVYLTSIETMFELWLLAGHPLPVRMIVYDDEAEPEWTVLGFVKVPVDHQPTDDLLQKQVGFNATATLPMDQDWPTSL